MTSIEKDLVQITLLGRTFKLESRWKLRAFLMALCATMAVALICRGSEIIGPAILLWISIEAAILARQVTNKRT